jgi:beta-galactosidase
LFFSGEIIRLKIEVYDLSDKYGIIVWSEIPFVGGYVPDPTAQANLKQMLIELIRQHYNHPSIMFWGLENEIDLSNNPVPFLIQLDSLAHQEDPMRLTTIATAADGDALNHVSDVMAWNKYYGWYGREFSDLATWADNVHRLYSSKAIAVSEFGAGASIYQHTQNIKSVSASSHFHPEEWRTDFHEASWGILKNRPFIWGKFVWCLADFGCYMRNEGTTKGINDKGLVTISVRNLSLDNFADDCK